MSKHRTFYATATALFLVAGLTTVFYTGPGHAFLRATVADTIVVPFLYFLWSAAYPTSRPIRAGGVLAVAFGLETLQLLELVEPDSHLLLQLTLGSTFDPLDLVAYTVGLAVALAIEEAMLRMQ